MTTLSVAKSLINFVCFTDIDECSPNPCEHGGQCVQTLNASYVCGCAAGYTGVNCSDGKNLFFTVYQHTILLPTAVVQQQQLAASEFKKRWLSKRG